MAVFRRWLPGPQTSTLTASGAAFTLFGIATAGNVSALLSPGAFSLSGQAIALKPTFAPGVASFTLSGQAIALSIRFALAPASFALTGRTSQIALPSNVGAFNLLGYDVEFETIWPLAVAPFTLTGQAVSFVSGGVLSSSVAAFTLSGKAVALSPSFTVARATYTFTGQAVTFLTAVNLVVNTATFLLTGQAAGFGRSVAAQVASFVLSGQAISARVSLAAAQGSFVLTGKAALFRALLGLATAEYSLLGWAVADAAGPGGDHIFLVELQGHDGATLLSFYLATAGYATLSTDAPASQFYDPRVIDPGNFERHLFSAGTTRGRSTSGAGDVIIANGDPGNGETLDDWLDYGFDERSIIIKALPVGTKNLAAASVLFRGRMQKLVSTRPLEQLEIKINDRLAELEKPLVTTRYAGTTTSTGATAEGNADLNGKVKQRVYGSASNVLLQPANIYDLIYLASNGACTSIDVYDGGLALINDGNSVSLAALQGASISAGHYRTCLSLGLARLGGTPVFAVTADVVVGATAADRTAAQVVIDMLTDFGIASLDISSGTFTALDGVNNAEVQYLVDDDRTALAAISDVLDSIGAWILPNRDGAFEVGRFEAPVSSPALRFDLDTQMIADTLERVDGEIPTWRVNLDYAPVFHVQGEDQLAGAVSASRRTFLGAATRSVSSEDASVKTKHLSAPELAIKTYLKDEADARDEADRLLALYSEERDRYRVSFPLADAWSAEPGVAITIMHPRLGLESGRAFAVIGREDVYAKESVTLELWG